MCLFAHIPTAVPGHRTREVYGTRPTCPNQLWQAEGYVRPTSLCMAGGTHRQESPGHWSDFPGHAWPAPLPQLIYTQKTASLNQSSHKHPKPSLAGCLLPPNKITVPLLAEPSQERLCTTAPGDRVPTAPVAATGSEKACVYVIMV